jgi:hypothetical protein
VIRGSNWLFIGISQPHQPIDITIHGTYKPQITRSITGSGLASERAAVPRQILSRPVGADAPKETPHFRYGIEIKQTFTIVQGHQHLCFLINDPQQMTVCNEWTDGTEHFPCRETNSPKSQQWTIR